MSTDNEIPIQHEREVRAGHRFRFGANWTRFLRRLNEARIAEAESNLKEFLGEELRRGKTFLDVGSGSGLSSLAARRLGATVTSFDFDPQSVACTAELRGRYLVSDLCGQLSKARYSTKDISALSVNSTSFIHGVSCTIPARCGKRWKTSSRWSSLAVCCSLRSTTIAVRSAEYGIDASVDITGCRGCCARCMCSTFGRPSN